MSHQPGADFDMTKKRLVTGVPLAWLATRVVASQDERVDQVVGMRCLISLGLIST